jgi:hypothetical protein
MPAKNRTGTATIKLTVSDGAASASRSFTLTVNAAPTITAISNQTILANTSTAALAFTVGDAETAASKLKVTATSSSTTLVPLSGIAFGGSGANRTVRVTPVKGRTGSVKITLTVSDGAATASRAFTVTIKSTASATRTPAAAAAAPVGLAPAIAEDPVSRVVRRGAGLNFRVTGTGTALTYQWLRNGEPVAGATSDVLAIPLATAGSAGEYAVDVSNAAGTVRSRPATLTVVTARLDTLAIDAAHAVLRASVAFAGPSDRATFDVLLPAGWSYRSGSQPAGAVPATGDKDLLEWSWETATNRGQTIVFVVDRAAGTPLPEQFTTLLSVEANGTVTPLAFDVPLTAAP